MNKKMTERIEALEKAVEAIGAWIGEQRRREAQAAADGQREPVISKVDEGGSPWFIVEDDKAHA